MLQEGLVQTLLDRGIINGATQILAEFNKVDNSFRALTLKDTFTVDNVETDESGKHWFNLIRLETKESVKLPTTSIFLIDGMEPAEIAKAFDLNVDGTKKVLGLRRGRPRKHFPYGKE
jgi:hypothetical protein